MNHSRGDLNMGIEREIKVEFPVWLILQPSIGSERREISFCSLIAEADPVPLPVDCTLSWTAATTRCHSGLVLEAPQLLLCSACGTVVSSVTQRKHQLLASDVIRHKPKDLDEPWFIIKYSSLRKNPKLNPMGPTWPWQRELFRGPGAGRIRTYLSSYLPL